MTRSRRKIPIVKGPKVKRNWYNRRVKRHQRQQTRDILTLKDILDSIMRPLRDYRDDYDGPILRQDILTLEDLHVNDKLEGTVRNVVDFGAFVDIGIKTAGLIHISELSKKRVKHPLDVVSVGDILTVMVISVDEKRGRIGLSLKQVPKEASL